MNAPEMLPNTPDCGAPCAICEAHAHAASRLNALCDKQAATIAKLRTALTEMQFAGHVGYVRTLAAKTLEETL